MSKTKEVLSNLPLAMMLTIEDLKKQYNNGNIEKDIIRAETRGYLKGLRQTDILKSDVEYRIVFTYVTL